MTKKSLWQLLLRRHRVWLILAAFFLIFFGVLQGTATVRNYQYQKRDPYTEKTFNKEVRPFLPKSRKNTTYIQYNRELQTEKYGSANLNLAAQNQTFFNFFSFLLMIIVGCIMSYWDQFSGFNRLLFSSGARRRDILLMKTKLYLSATLPAYLASMAITFAFIWTGIPHEFLVFHWASILINIPAFLLQLIAGLAAGGLFGMVIGQTLPLVLTVGFLGITVEPAASRIISFFGGGTQVYHFLSLTVVNYGFWILMTILFFGLCLVFYPHLSLENTHQYLLFPALRPWVLIAFTLYIPLYMQDWLFTGNHVLSMAITAFAVFLFLYWYLYRPQWLGRKSTQSANHSQTPAP